MSNFQGTADRSQIFVNASRPDELAMISWMGCDLPDSVLTQVLASACGRYGTTLDYVEQTANALRSHAMPDLNLEARLKRCCLVSA